MKLLLSGFGIGGEASGGLPPSLVKRLAKPHLAAYAPVALAAGGDGFGSNPIASLPACHSGAYLNDAARVLVAVTRRQPLNVGMQIGAAYPAIAHLYQDFVLVQYRLRRPSDSEFPLANQDCFQHFILSSVILPSHGMGRLEHLLQATRIISSLAVDVIIHSPISGMITSPRSKN